MPKGLGIAIAVGAVVVLGLGGFVVYKKVLKPAMAPAPQQMAPAPTQSGAPKQSSVMQSLKDLLMSGATVKCDVSYASDKVSTKGTTYVSGKNIRADFTTTMSDGKTVTGHMVQDGTYAYVWTDLAAMGTKMKIEALTAAGQNASGSSQTGPAAPSQAVDVNQKMNTTCGAWVADPTMFTPPANINFTDISQFMMKAPKIPAAPAPTPSGY